MASAQFAETQLEELPVEKRSVKALQLQQLKRSFDLFAGNHESKPDVDTGSQEAKLRCKIRDEYESVKDMPPPEQAAAKRAAVANGAAPSLGGATEVTTAAEDTAAGRSSTARMLDNIAAERASVSGGDQQQLVVHGGAMNGVANGGSKALLLPTAAGGNKEYTPSAAVARRLPSKWPRPVWHPPWKLFRVISGHLGWVRSVAVDPGNEWFATGSADRTIKIWDLASGQLKLTLTGHIEQVTGLAVSDRHPYMFSAGLDKMVKCWDLEYNKVIRHYHGHLSGVYSLALHPNLDLLMTGGRDSVCRVWDMRSKVQAHVLSGHDDTVCSILSQASDPQVVTGSHDKTVKLWDLRKGKAMATLTYHKKSVRGLALHPTEYCFASASAENIKKFRLPRGEFLHNMLQNQKSIVNTMAVNEDGVLASGADNGSLWLWDWKSGNCFQQHATQVQPGSLESEAGIFAMTFDKSGGRLICAEADKTIKMYKEDEQATPETHPVSFRPPKDIRRF
ncbi:Prolactin-2C3 [Trebouxia sp. C0009 RCD-2024]